MSFEHALYEQGVCRQSQIYSLDNVRITMQLGKGGAGIVYKGEVGDHQVLAVKCIDKKKVARKQLQNQLALEIAVHQTLTHPNIVRFYDFSHDHDFVYFYLEYAAGGDMFQYVRTYQPEEATIAYLLYQVADALAFCHDHGVVHRDMKPENILMTEAGEPKLTDFGFADRVVRGECRHPMSCGTTDFMAPEMVEGAPCGFPIDVWAFGVIIYDLLVGHTPFHEDSRKKTYKRIVLCDVAWDPVWEYECTPLLERIFVYDPAARPTMEEVMTDPWFSLEREYSVDSVDGFGEE